LRFATVLSVSGTDGSGGAVDDAVAVAVGVVLLLDPVRPTPVLAMHAADVASREY
jgi:hypothetical protein